VSNQEGEKDWERQEGSALLVDSIFQNHLVNDLTADDTSPPKKLFLKPIELLKDHMSTTSRTLHGALLSIIDFM
jgi:hypothetical protein